MTLGLRTARLLQRYTFLFALVLTAGLLVANILTVSGGFGLTQQLSDFAPIALVAMASTPAIISGGGGLDLSISPLTVLISAVFVEYLAPHGLGGAVAVPILLAIGAFVGAVNGGLIVVLRLPPVVVTLATYFILIGVDALVVPQPASVSSTWMTHLAGSVGPIPGAVFDIGAPLLIWVLIGLVPYKNLLYAIGSHAPTAFSSGINVIGVKVAAYALGGMFAAFAGLALVALDLSASADLATTYTLLAIASVALGGTSLAGGRGGLLGSLLGGATIYLLSNLLQTLQIPAAWLQVMYGLTLLAAVLISSGISRVGVKE